MAVPNHFDRSKPFYPLVMNYLLLLAGWKEIAASRLPGINRAFTADKQLVEGCNPNAAAQLSTQLEKLLGPLELKCESHPERVTVSIDQLGHELAANHNYVASFLMRAAGSLLILAHESTKDEPYHDTGELWEFLRHCRNAAAHGGSFNFVGGEPRRPAVWSGITLTSSLNGTPLFKNDTVVGTLSPGDPIRLLWDLEQTYPEMKAAP
jgi:hypothetical protein